MCMQCALDREIALPFVQRKKPTDCVVGTPKKPWCWVSHLRIILQPCDETVACLQWSLDPHPKRYHPEADQTL